jgi:hypothetical protein
VTRQRCGASPLRSSAPSMPPLGSRPTSRGRCRRAGRPPRRAAGEKERCRLGPEFTQNFSLLWLHFRRNARANVRTCMTFGPTQQLTPLDRCSSASLATSVSPTRSRRPRSRRRPKHSAAVSAGYAPGRGPWSHSDAVYLISSVILHTEYAKRCLNDSTGRG